MHRIIQALIFGPIAVALAASVVAEERPARYATPQEAFAARDKAWRESDAKTAWNCLAEKERKSVLFEMAFSLGMRRDSDWIDEHLDEQKSQRWRQKHGLAADAQVPEELVHEEFYSSLKDPFAFFATALKKIPKETLHEAKAEPLRDVRIGGDRARGVVTRHIEVVSSTGDGILRRERKPFESPLFFQKTEHGWLIDAPTAEEVEAEVRALGPIGPIKAD